MPTESAIVDFSNTDAKRALLSRLGALRGRYRVEVVKFRPRRSLAQNAYYWGCITTPLANWLSEQEAEPVEPEAAHGILAAKFLTIDVVDKRTGEVLGQRVRSTTELSTLEFMDYCERARAWLAEFFGIIVPDPLPGDFPAEGGQQ